MPDNLRLSAGAAAGPASAVTGREHARARRPAAVVDADTAALVAGMRRGLLVSDFWYTRVLDPKSLVVTGLTRNGVWLVEDGVSCGRCATSGSPSRTRGRWGRGRCSGSAARRCGSRTGSDGTWWTAPPLRLASWHFTGGASG